MKIVINTKKLYIRQEGSRFNDFVFPYADFVMWFPLSSVTPFEK